MQKSKLDTDTYRLHTRYIKVVDAMLLRDHPGATAHQLAELRRYYLDGLLESHVAEIDRLMLMERVEQAARWCSPPELPFRVGHVFGLPDDTNTAVIHALMEMAPDERETKLIEIERFFGNRGDGDHDK